MPGRALLLARRGTLAAEQGERLGTCRLATPISGASWLAEEMLYEAEEPTGS